MAARKRPFSPAKLAEMRDRISATLLIKRLADHALGECEMTQTQVSAANILLKKCLPDLTAIEHSGEIETKRAVELPDDELADIATGSRNRASEAESGAEIAASVH